MRWLSWWSNWIKGFACKIPNLFCRGPSEDPKIQVRRLREQDKKSLRWSYQPLSSGCSELQPGVLEIAWTLGVRQIWLWIKTWPLAAVCYQASYLTSLSLLSIKKEMTEISIFQDISIKYVKCLILRECSIKESSYCLEWACEVWKTEMKLRKWWGGLPLWRPQLSPCLSCTSQLNSDEAKG